MPVHVYLYHSKRTGKPTRRIAANKCAFTGCIRQSKRTGYPTRIVVADEYAPTDNNGQMNEGAFQKQTTRNSPAVDGEEHSSSRPQPAYQLDNVTRAMLTEMFGADSSERMLFLYATLISLSLTSFWGEKHRRAPCFIREQ